MLCSELTNVFAFGLPLSQLVANHFRQQLFCFDQRNLNVSVRVAVERQLTCHAFRQRSIQVRVFFCQLADDISALFAFLDHLEFGIVFSQEVVQFGDQAFHSRNEFDQTFGDQHRTEVVTVGSTFCNDFCDIGNDIVQRHVLCFHFFRYDRDIRLCLQSTFQCDVRSRAAHQFDEVPVFLG